MKKNTLFVLISIIVIILFLCIQISYNSSPSYSIFSFLQKTVEYDIENGFTIKFSHYPLEFNLLLIEIIICSIFLIVCSFFSNWIRIISLILFVGLWLKNYIMLDFVIDAKEYLFTSTPFLLVSLVYLVVLIFKINAERPVPEDKL